MTYPLLSGGVLNTCVTLLDEGGYHRLASEFTGMLNRLSVNGLVAENCSLGRHLSGTTRR